MESRAGTPNDGYKTQDFKLNVQSRSPGRYTLSGNELNQVLQDPKQLVNLGRLTMQPGKKGLVVEDAPRGSLADKLGLQQGDVVLQVNGLPLSSNEDITHFYQQLNKVGQVRLICMRSGKALVLNYTIE